MLRGGILGSFAEAVSLRGYALYSDTDGATGKEIDIYADVLAQTGKTVRVGDTAVCFAFGAQTTSLPSTPSGWNSVQKFTLGSPSRAKWCLWKQLDGTEVPFQMLGGTSHGTQNHTMIALVFKGTKGKTVSAYASIGGDSTGNLSSFDLGDASIAVPSIFIAAIGAFDGGISNFDFLLDGNPANIESPIGVADNDTGLNAKYRVFGFGDTPDAIAVDPSDTGDATARIGLALEIT